MAVGAVIRHANLTGPIPVYHIAVPVCMSRAGVAGIKLGRAYKYKCCTVQCSRVGMESLQVPRKKRKKPLGVFPVEKTLTYGTVICPTQLYNKINTIPELRNIIVSFLRGEFTGLVALNITIGQVLYSTVQYCTGSHLGGVKYWMRVVESLYFMVVVI